MARNDYYTFKSDPNDEHHFECIAVDSDFEVTKRYHINRSACECWAGQKWCRHKKMLVIFKRDNLLNSNRYYNFDREVWLPKIKGES